MIKKLLLVALLICQPVWATTYYMRELGTAADKAAAVGPCSDATKTMSIATHNVQTFSGDDVILVCNDGGTFQTTNLVPPFSGTSGHPITYIKAQSALPVIQGVAGDHPVYINAKNYVTLSGLVITGSVAGKYNVRIVTGTGDIIQDCDLRGGNASLQVQTDAVIKRTILGNNTNTSLNVSINGGSAIFSYCLFLGMVAPTAIIDGTTITFNNCLFAGSVKEAITSTTSTQVVNVNNSIFAGNVTGWSDTTYVINNTAGIFTLTNCLLLPNPDVPDTYFTNGTTDGGGNVYSIPMFRSPRRPAIVILGIDDYTNLAQWTAVADKVAAKGWKSRFSIVTGGVTAGDWSTMATYAAAGHEIAPHTRHHVKLTNLNAITIDYTAACTTATVTINVAGDYLKTTIDGVQDMNLTLSSYTDMTALKNAINAYSANYTAATSSSQTYNAIGSELADVAGANIKATVYQVLFDLARYEAEEIDGSIADVQANIPGYTVKTFTFPYDATSTVLQDYVQTKGLIAARGNYLPGTATSSLDLTNLYIYRVFSFATVNDPGTTNIARNTAAILEFLNYTGGIWNFYAHANAEFSLAQWDTLLDAVAKSNATVMTLADAATYIRANWTDADGNGKRWTKTFSDGSDYRLQSGSPAINAGTNLGSTYQMGLDNIGSFPWTLVNQSLYGGWEIGAFVYPVRVMVSE